MPYAVMQKGLEAPTVEQLRAAFQGIPGLTPMDAPILCKDAFGILVKGFELERANMLQTALAAQGVETEVVDEATLPVLPQIRHLNQVNCTPEALIIYDPLGRNFPLEWKNIMMIAAGKVRFTDFKRVMVPRPAMTHGRNAPTVVYEAETHEEQADHWTVEIVVTGAVLRYGIQADRPGGYLFQYLGERRTDDLAANFKLLIQDLCRFAPEATINRGAYYLRENSAPAWTYPTKNAFYEEMVWLLWKLLPGNPPS